MGHVWVRIVTDGCDIHITHTHTHKFKSSFSSNTFGGRLCDRGELTRTNLPLSNHAVYSYEKVDWVSCYSIHPTDALSVE